MKRFLKEFIILFLQLLLFYIFPLFSNPINTIGMVLIIILMTFFLSFIIGCISKEKFKYLYPAIVAIAFVPSVFIYYNDSALIHTIWYFIISGIGLMLGAIIYKLIHKK